MDSGEQDIGLLSIIMGKNESYFNDLLYQPLKKLKIAEKKVNN